MGILQNLSAIAVQQLTGWASDATGITGLDAVVGLFTKHFTAHSKRMTEALENANDRAWKAVEIALAGESWWDQVKVRLSSGDDQEFRRQVRAFLDAAPFTGADSPDFRRRCLRELHAARKAKLLTAGALDVNELARQAGAFAAFSDPTALLGAERQLLAGAADALRQAGLPALARFVEMRPAQGEPLLAAAARYYFRREIETDSELFQGLTFRRLEKQEEALAGLADALAAHGRRLEELLDLARETHEAVLDLQAEQRRQGRLHEHMYDAVLRLERRFDLSAKELRPSHTFSIRDDVEREAVRRLLKQFRALPPEERRRMPALLNGLGKLQMAAGELDAAPELFAEVADSVDDAQAKAEARHNAYLAALERGRWREALEELRQALALDPARWAPFPLDKYEPERILGAGGFGAAFLCRHKHSGAQVVVKAILAADLDRDLGAVLQEASTLEQLDHAAIIRLRDCGYTGAAATRPYLVMDYFDAPTLEEHVRRNGPLPPADAAAIGGQVLDGLAAAHARGVLHRDVKPSNLLVKRDGDGWRVKLIDFGLALRRQVVRDTVSTPETASRSVRSGRIAGTLDYAAPEQMGKLPGAAVRPCSDVYGFGRTMCYTLFGTPNPGPKHWKQLPDLLTDLLGECLEEQPARRPQDCAAVRKRLAPPPPAPPASAGPKAAERVPVVDVKVDPLKVDVATVRPAQVEMPGLPPIPADILEFEGRLGGLSAAVEGLEKQTHPSLAPGLRSVESAEKQWQAAEGAVRTSETGVAPEARLKMREELTRDPGVSNARLCGLAGDASPGVLLYVQRLRVAVRARQVLTEARQTYEQQRSEKANALREEAKDVEVRLTARQQYDFHGILDALYERAGRDEFPLEGWIRLAPLLDKRRYRFAVTPSDLLHAAETYHGEWKARRRAEAVLWQSARQADELAFQSAMQADSVKGWDAYLSLHPQGSHTEEARRRLGQVRRRKRLTFHVCTLVFTLLGGAIGAVAYRLSPPKQEYWWQNGPGWWVVLGFGIVTFGFVVGGVWKGSVFKGDKLSVRIEGVLGLILFQLLVAWGEAALVLATWWRTTGPSLVVPALIMAGFGWVHGFLVWVSSTKAD